MHVYIYDIYIYILIHKYDTYICIYMVIIFSCMLMKDPGVHSPCDLSPEFSGQFIQILILEKPTGNLF